MTTSPPGTTEPVFELSGGRLCLDFVNTVSGDRAGEARERLAAYPSLLAWARQACAIEPAKARSLLAEARRRPDAASAVLREALAIREALYRVFVAVASGDEPGGEDLARVSAFVGSALAHRRLERRDGELTLGWEDAEGALEAPLWPVAASAAELLTSPERARIRVCGLHDTHECSWLFLDTTRARTRRWCSMKDCGNKAKARRHYARAKAE